MTTSTQLTRRRVLRLGAAAAAASSLALLGHAQDPPAGSPQPSDTGAEFINKDTEDAIALGLDFLSKNQSHDGSYTDHPTGASVGITSLCGLALMSAGNQPGRGPAARNVSRALDYVLSCANGTTPGFLTAVEQSMPIRGGGGAQQQSMYSHGFGCLFLAEVCGMVPDRVRQSQVKAVLERAVAIGVGAQNKEGGWRYEPKPPPIADVSVTVAQMMAFRAAKNAGVTVRPEVILAGVRYILDCQLADGGFSYYRGQGYSAFARTAAAVGGLYSVGTVPDKELSKAVERSIDRGLKYLKNYIPGRQFTFREIPPPHYFYGQYYAALAMWMAGGEYWAQWFPAIRDELLSRTRGPGGSWTDGQGPAYGTAMSLIVLQLPNNYLPILQK